MKYILGFFLLVTPFVTNAQYVMNVSHKGNTIFAERTENIDSIYFTSSAGNGAVETGVAYASGDSLYKSRVIGYKGESLSISLHVGYINGGNIVEQINYVHTSPICLRKGQTISLTGVCETAVNAISLTDQSGVSFSNLVKGKGIGQEVYEYTATEQCYVSLTYCTNFSHSIISFTETNGVLSRRLKKLEDNMVTYNGSVPSYSDNPLRDLHYYPGFSSVFKSWGFIGDSMTEGVIQYKNADGEMKYDVDNYYSWGQCMCRATGADGTNFATDAITAKAWILDESNKGWGGVRNKLKQAYIIALGYNDRWIYECGSVDKDIDINNYENNAPTFAGSYAGIIQRIKSVNPKAYVFVVTMPKSREGEEDNDWNRTIRRMANLFSNTYVIDLFTYAPVYDESFKEKYWSEGHLTPMGYQYTAFLMMTYIDWIVQNNYQDFKLIHLH